MDVDKEKIAAFVRGAVAGLLDCRPDEVSEDARLVGEDAVMASRDLVVLMLDLEEYLENEFGAAFNWTSDSAMSGGRSSLRTVGTLIGLVAERAANAGK